MNGLTVCFSASVRLGFLSVFRRAGLPLVAFVERAHSSDPGCSRSQKGFHSFLSAVIHWCPFKTANEIHPKEGLGEMDTSIRVQRRYNWTVAGVKKKSESYFDWEEKAICHGGFAAFQRYKAGFAVYQEFHMDKYEKKKTVDGVQNILGPLLIVAITAELQHFLNSHSV